MIRSCHSRRQFLKTSSLIAMASSVPEFLRKGVHAAEPTKEGRILVVIQLSGGNDGINTVVPFADEGYAKHRDNLRIQTDRLIKINDQIGLHPSLRPAADLLEQGKLAIVQGVGYPNPNRSHEVSMAIWQTARFDSTEHKSFGWIGRALDGHKAPVDGSPHALHMGNGEQPIALRGRRTTSVSLSHLDDLKLRTGIEMPNDLDRGDGDSLLAFTRRVSMDARATAALIEDVTTKSARQEGLYPRSALAGNLRNIAQLIKSNFATPIYYAIQPGYDTHAIQLGAHSRLLGELSSSLKAFLDDLQSAGLADRVAILCFSEFGRRVSENASQGTDHGTAGPVFVAGSGIHPGLLGQPPSLTDLENSDLKMQCDFRQVYATILDDWLGIPSTPVTGGNFGKLELFVNG